MYYLYTHTHTHTHIYMGFLGGSTSSKESLANAGNTKDMGSIPGSKRSPGVGNGNLLQYSYLDNSMDRGTWRTIFHGATVSQTQQSN